VAGAAADAAVSGVDASEAFGRRVRVGFSDAGAAFTSGAFAERVGALFTALSLAAVAFPESLTASELSATLVGR